LQISSQFQIQKSLSYEILLRALLIISYYFSARDFSLELLQVKK
jgi:hypothetical protein